jgi:cell wall-associated NlpC family hydrolase
VEVIPHTPNVRPPETLCREQIQIGDLVFFEYDDDPETNAYPYEIDHVGMALGMGKRTSSAIKREYFISSRKGLNGPTIGSNTNLQSVLECPSSEWYWGRNFRCVRRL